MKKMIYSFALAGSLVLLSYGLSMAQVSAPGKKPVSQPALSGFVDTNMDGICDRYNGVRPGKGKGPGNGQGLGQATGKGIGWSNGLRNGNCQRCLNGSRAGRNPGTGRQLRDGSGANCPRAN